MTNRKSLAVLCGGLAFAAGCYSLDVAAVQPAGGTAFTREEVLKDPALIELVVAGLFINFWGGATYAQPWTVFSIYGEEITSAVIEVNNFNRGATQRTQIWEHVQEPRAAFNNSLTGSSFLARDPWSNFYESNAAATEMSRVIKSMNIRVIDQATGIDNTTRVLTFAKWMQGLSHIHLGMLFDSAAIVHEGIDLSRVPNVPYRGYREVLDSGIKWLEEAIASAEENTFLLPLNDDLWVYNTAFTNDQMKAVSHSYIARALAYSARTPAEREAVNWALVKEHILQGTSAPFGPTGFPNPLISFDYRQSMTSAPRSVPFICNSGGSSNGTNFCVHAGEFRVDLRLLGPADTSGAYQQWLEAASGPNFRDAAPFVVRTPDRRIQSPEMTAPLIKPTYFKYTDTLPVAAFDTLVRGAYYISNYWNSTLALDNGTQLPKDGGGRNRRNLADLGFIQDAMLTPVEMDLLLAEAEFRLGNLAAAADLINKTRTINGELPAVTVNGVPQSNSCVPKLYDGSCGSLWDALMYEKRIETYGRAISFFDLRGWGCLTEGTLTQLPPPGRQLDISGKNIYTFGGAPGQAGSAAKPTNCPLLHRP